MSMWVSNAGRGNMLVANGTFYARALAYPSPFVILRINELCHSNSNVRGINVLHWHIGF